MTNVQQVLIRYIGFAAQPSPPPGNPSLWKVVEQACGPVLCWRSQALHIEWKNTDTSARPSADDWRRWLCLKGHHEVELATSVKRLTLQTRRIGNQPDSISTLAMEMLHVSGFRDVERIWFARQAEFELASLAPQTGETLDLLRGTLEKVMALGSKSGFFEPSVEEARTVLAGGLLNWASSKTVAFQTDNEFMDQLNTFLSNGEWEYLRRNFRLTERKFRATEPDFEGVKNPSKILSRVGVFQEEVEKIQGRNNPQASPPVSFIVSLPKKSDSYASQEKFRVRCETIASQYDRSPGVVLFRPSSLGVQQFDVWSPLPLTQGFLPKAPNPTARLCVLGPWDSRNFIVERRVESWANQMFPVTHGRNYLSQGEVVSGNQDWISYLVSQLVRENTGWRIHKSNFSELMKSNSLKSSCDRVWFFWVDDRDFNRLVEISGQFGLRILGLAQIDPTGEIRFVSSKSNEIINIKASDLSASNESRDKAIEVKWNYPEPKAPLYGFDRVSQFPDRYLARISVRESSERSWNHEVKRMSSGDRFRSILLRNPTCIPLHGFRWSDGENDWAQAFASKAGWAEIDPRESGVSSLEAAARMIVALGAIPMGAYGSIWTSVPSDLESSENSPLAAYVLSLEGVASVAAKLGIRLSYVQGQGATFEKSSPEMYVSLMSQVASPTPDATPGFRMSGEVIYAIGPKPIFVDAGSHILKCVPRVFSNHLTKVDFDYALPFYQLVVELMKKGVITGIRPIFEGGAVAAVGEMSLWGRIGAQMRTGLTPVDLFSGAPGRFVVSVLPQNVRAFENGMRSEYLTLLGVAGGEKVLGFPLESFIETRLAGPK